VLSSTLQHCQSLHRHVPQQHLVTCNYCTHVTVLSYWSKSCNYCTHVTVLSYWSKSCNYYTHVTVLSYWSKSCNYYTHVTVLSYWSKSCNYCTHVTILSYWSKSHEKEMPWRHVLPCVRAQSCPHVEFLMFLK